MLEIIKLILKAVGAFFGWKEQSDALSAGGAKQEAKNATEALNAIKTAQAARDATRATDAGTHTGSPDNPGDAAGLPDDGFRRD
jgi:hypothetical protein